MHDILDDIKEKGLYRQLQVASGLDFSSNDYLGLSKSNFLQERLQRFIKDNKYLWNTSSRLISGTTNLHLLAEENLSLFLDREATLIFSSGHLANLGVISSLCKNSLIFSDELNHASIIDGIKLSKSQYIIYPHNDLLSLQKALQAHYTHSMPKVIITESLFSMNGSKVDINALFEIAREYNALLIIDEAHATGIFGSQGQGIVGDLNKMIENKMIKNKMIENKIVTIHTGGKALASPGAFVGCSKLVKEILVNTSRSFIYSTALHPINTFMLNESVEHIRNSDLLRKKLFNNIKYAKFKLNMSSIDIPSPIIPFMVFNNQIAQNIATQANRNGVCLKAIRYPTVPKGSERIRISIHADHTFEQIDFMAKTILQASDNYEMRDKTCKAFS